MLVPRSEPIVRTERLLLGLWAAFWALMLMVAIRDYARGGGADWWKPARST